MAQDSLLDSLVADTETILEFVMSSADKRVKRPLKDYEEILKDEFSHTLKLFLQTQDVKKERKSDYV